MPFTEFLRTKTWQENDNTNGTQHAFVAMLEGSVGTGKMGQGGMGQRSSHLLMHRASLQQPL